MKFLITRSVTNPLGRRFAVGSDHPETLPKGTIATLGDEDDPDLTLDDEELLKLARSFIELPTPKNIARVQKEIEAEEKYWQSQMDDGSAGGCSFFGFRAYRIGNAQAAQ